MKKVLYIILGVLLAVAVACLVTCIASIVNHVSFTDQIVNWFSSDTAETVAVLRNI